MALRNFPVTERRAGRAQREETLPAGFRVTGFAPFFQRLFS